MPYDDDDSSPQPKQESTMSSGPDWNWIGYMNSFDNESGNGGGGNGGGCLSVLIDKEFENFRLLPDEQAVWDFLHKHFLILSTR